jgi:hypothetical protein
VTTINFNPEPLHDKYEVKKIDTNEVLEPGTYFVLRRQDMLAEHALWSYIGVLRVAYELLKEDDDADDIMKLAEKISGFALAWQTDPGEKKLPD